MGAPDPPSENASGRIQHSTLMAPLLPTFNVGEGDTEMELAPSANTNAPPTLPLAKVTFSTTPVLPPTASVEFPSARHHAVIPWSGGRHTGGFTVRFPFELAICP